MSQINLFSYYANYGKLWYFCHRDSEQYTDTIYSTDINGKKSHRDQNEANASKFPNVSLSEGEIRHCDG